MIFRNHWLISSIIYLIFLFWYTNISGPLSEAEIDLAIKRIENSETVISQGDRENFFKFLQEDDGGDFYMVNFLDINENPPFMEKTGQGASAFELLNIFSQ